MAMLENYVALFTPMVITVIVAVVPSFSCSSLQYWVGDSLWTIPPFPDYYSNWSSSHFFKIGDSLVFDFETGRYNVIQVTRQEYESCTSWSPIKIINGGPGIIPLTERGVFYFICNFSNYCSLGQKIDITVHDCRESYPPAPAPSPVSPPSPAPAVVAPSLTPYNNGSGQPSVKVPSPAPPPIGNGDALVDNAPAPENSAAIMSGGRLSFVSSIGSIVSGWRFGILVYAGMIFCL
ncbi:Phytocyanin domain containing protein [Parasponia andersonii]|uniref:Phytocyanin domain containing protein n=1 Tax=Parasponia andersonii TaxID=3476 RepID=A0A2P5DAB9_PARAD|nr:Phytocyanin domain containing protein [Parasponia andersonii]